jgi:hypothetical protein
LVEVKLLLLEWAMGDLDALWGGLSSPFRCSSRFDYRQHNQDGGDEQAFWRETGFREMQ